LPERDGAYFAPGVLLSDGRVLIAGGANIKPDGTFITLNSAEIYDPRTGSFSVTGNMNSHRFGPWLILQRDGKVLVLGGVDHFTFITDSLNAELYDPKAGTFSLLAAGPNANNGAAATMLSPKARIISSRGFAKLRWPRAKRESKDCDARPLPNPLPEGRRDRKSLCPNCFVRFSRKFILALGLVMAWS